MLRDVVVENPTLPAAPIDVTATTEEGQEVTLAKVNLDDVRQIASFTEPNPIIVNGEQTAIFPLGVREYKFTVNVPSSNLPFDCTNFVCIESENGETSYPLLPSEFTYTTTDLNPTFSARSHIILINSINAGWIINYEASQGSSSFSFTIPAGSWYAHFVPTNLPTGVSRLPFLFCNDAQGRMLAGIYDGSTTTSNQLHAYAIVPITYMTISTLPNSPT